MLKFRRTDLRVCGDTMLKIRPRYDGTTLKLETCTLADQDGDPEKELPLERPSEEKRAFENRYAELAVGTNISN